MDHFESMTNYSTIVDEKNVFNDDDNAYRRGMKNLYEYRRKLVNKFETLNYDLSTFRKSQTNFQEKILDGLRYNEQSKIINDDCDEILFKLSKQDELVFQLIMHERSKWIIHLFKITCQSVQLVREHYTILKNEQKNLQTLIILNRSNLLMENYVKVINAFNVLLRMGVDESSQLYKYFYDYVKENNDNIEQLFVELFVYSFGLVRWPSITADISDEPLPINRQLFTKLLRFLMELQTGTFAVEHQVIEKNLVKRLPIFSQKPKKNDDLIGYNCVLTLMIEPFIKRFQFYFLNPNSKLNDVKFPEWYLCQVEQWITKNERFLLENVDPILEDFNDGQEFVSSKIYLIYKLLSMVKMKLSHDAQRWTDDRILCVTIDEVVIFNKQISFIQTDIFEKYPNLNPLSALFDNPHYYGRFLAMEKNKLNEFVESIFESETSWSLVYGNEMGDDDKHIICEAADKFALLIHNLIERSAYIGVQFQSYILDMIAHVLDDFRLRLSQLIHDYNESWPFSQKFFSILNTFDFLLAMINDLKINLVINDEESDHFEAKRMLFVNLPKTFQHMIDEIFERISAVIMSYFFSDLERYKKLKWHTAFIKDRPSQMSKEAVDLFFNISAKINLIKRFTSSNLFKEFIHDFAIKIQDALFEHFLLKQDLFSRDGIKQFEIDCKQGLFTIFSTYMKDVEYTFSKIFDCLAVLKFSEQTYQNLRTRHQIDGELEFRVYLQSLGIYSLKPVTVMAIIAKRIKS